VHHWLERLFNEIFYQVRKLIVDLGYHCCLDLLLDITLALDLLVELVQLPLELLILLKQLLVVIDNLDFLVVSGRRLFFDCWWFD